MTKAECGRLGGLATLEKHGKDHFQKIGSNPKPKCLTLSQILEIKNKEKKEEVFRSPSQLNKKANEVLYQFIHKSGIN